MKYLTAKLRKSSTVISSSLIVMNAKHRVIAAGIKFQVLTRITTEIRAAIPSIAKSLSDQSHRFVFAFKFCG